MLNKLSLEELCTLLAKFESDLKEVETLTEQDYILGWIRQLKKDIANKTEELEVQVLEALKEAYEEPAKQRKVYVVVDSQDRLMSFDMGLTGALVRYAFTSKPAATKKAEKYNLIVREFYTSVLGSIQEEGVQYDIKNDYYLNQDKI